MKKGIRGKHPKSLWYDDSLHPKSIDLIEGASNIFEIIMPWVPEELEEKGLSKRDDKHAEKKGPV